jgi:hypothetical protein
MEIIEFTGPPYPNARELPNHGGRPISKHQKSPGGNSGAGKARNNYVPRLTGKLLSELQKDDRAQTEANKTVMWLYKGKRRFVKASEYERLRADAQA